MQETEGLWRLRWPYLHHLLVGEMKYDHGYSTLEIQARTDWGVNEMLRRPSEPPSRVQPMSQCFFDDLILMQNSHLSQDSRIRWRSIGYWVMSSWLSGRDWLEIDEQTYTLFSRINRPSLQIFNTCKAFDSECHGSIEIWPSERPKVIFRAQREISRACKMD